MPDDWRGPRIDDATIEAAISDLLEAIHDLRVAKGASNEIGRRACVSSAVETVAPLATSLKRLLTEGVHT